jgi:hypothetical protein
LFYLLLHGLVLFVPDSLPPIFLSYLAILSSSFAIARITSVPLGCSHCSQHDVMQGCPQLQETKMTMKVEVEKLRRGDKENNDND